MSRSSLRFQAHRSPAGAGFTLIELMVVVAIIGILSTVAYPAYGKYLIKSHRAAAQVHLMELAQAQSQHMADARTYTTTLSTPPAAVSERYAIAIKIEDGPPSTFTITATPVTGSAQAADGALSIDSAGTRTPAAKW